MTGGHCNLCGAVIDRPATVAELRELEGTSRRHYRSELCFDCGQWALVFLRALPVSEPQNVPDPPSKLVRRS